MNRNANFFRGCCTFILFVLFFKCDNPLDSEKKDELPKPEIIDTYISFKTKRDIFGIPIQTTYTHYAEIINKGMSGEVFVKFIIERKDVLRTIVFQMEKNDTVKVKTAFYIPPDNYSLSDTYQWSAHAAQSGDKSEGYMEVIR